MVTLTEAAANFIKAKLLSPLGGVRFNVTGGGCSGFEYGVEMEHASRVFELPKKDDKVFLSEGVRIVVDKKSLMFLDGMSVDLVEENLGHRLVFNNPNSSGTCGCGTSFSI